MPDVAAPVADALPVAQRLAFERLLAQAPEAATQATYRNLIEKAEFVATHGEVRPDELARYAGRYGIRTISVVGEGLRFQRDDGPPIDLTPVGEHAFELDVAMTPKPRIRFDMEAGTAAAMWLGLGGGEQRIARDP